LIGICSPCGPTPDAATALERATRALEARGYRTVVSPHAMESLADAGRVYLAGTDAVRAADLNAMLADPEIDLILCARGGYGAMRILDRIDYAAAVRDPKPVVGYSDVTALSLGLWARAGVGSFSGIMAASGNGFAQAEIDAYSVQSFFDAVGGERGDFQPRLLRSPEGSHPWTIHRAPRDGGSRIVGPLAPVCLSLLNPLVGTPYLPDLRGCILVIEDIGEWLYAVDRYLTQLRLAGLLDGLAGVLVGSFNGTADQDDLLRREVPELVMESTPDTVPVASGVAYGHLPTRLTLPVGVTCTVDLVEGTFSF
jgi:muramoyltetrapeptide carboxypeptidase